MCRFPQVTGTEPRVTEDNVDSALDRLQQVQDELEEVAGEVEERTGVDRREFIKHFLYRHPFFVSIQIEHWVRQNDGFVRCVLSGNE